MTVWHLRDLASGKRTMIKCTEVRVIINIPHYESLRVDDLLKFAKEWKDGLNLKALPEVEGEILKLPRAYIGNIIYTIADEDFQDWVQKRINIRNTKVMEDKDMLIDLDPDIDRIFKQSSSVSGKCLFCHSMKTIFIILVTKGISNNLMKRTAQRRRTKI